MSWNRSSLAGIVLQSCRLRLGAHGCRLFIAAVAAAGGLPVRNPWILQLCAGQSKKKVRTTTVRNEAYLPLWNKWTRVLQVADAAFSKKKKLLMLPPQSTNDQLDLPAARSIPFGISAFKQSLAPLRSWRTCFFSGKESFKYYSEIELHSWAIIGVFGCSGTV